MRLATSLTAALAVSFSTVALGQNACLTGSESRCISGTTDVDLSRCSITDEDNAALKLCLDTIGRSDIITLRLHLNDMETIETDTFANMASLINLWIYQNALTTLGAGLFEDLASLESLQLNDNVIGTIDVGAFRGLGSLQTLLLYRNALTALDGGLFDGLDSLLDLQLNDNAIGDVDPDAFLGLGDLQTLYIHNNALTTLGSGMFSLLGSLQTLWFYGSGIETIEVGAFSGWTSLLTLRLENNALTTLDVGVFDDLGSLQTLWIYQNGLTTLDAGLFAGLGSLLDLRLEDNEIGTIDTDAFSGMGSLQTLLLSYNALTTLQAGVFSTLSSTTALFLDNNNIATMEAGVFDDVPALVNLRLHSNQLTTVGPGIFNSLASLTTMWMHDNDIGTIDADAFQGMVSLQTLFLFNSALTTVAAGTFDNLGALKTLYLYGNDIGTIEAGVFQGLAALVALRLDANELTTVDAGLFDNLGSLEDLRLQDNMIATIEADAFMDLASLKTLYLSNNALTTLPAGIFEDLGTGSSLQTLVLDGNSGLQCVPTVNSPFAGALPQTDGTCGCAPAVAVTCDAEVEVCVPGAVGYTCIPGCTDDNDCDANTGEVCCSLTKVCENPNDVDVGACGDPHMTGFRGQKFDFAGKDNGWYALVSDIPYMHLNMRVTSPVPSVPEITYITGLSIVTTDADGLEHTIIVSVANPHSLESSCPAGTPSCLADGALNVLVDGEEVLLAPGEVTIAPDVSIAAVNLPGECRSFGFEKYWERKKLELLAQAGRKLTLISSMQDMSDWVLSDPTATNMVECADYVAGATAVGGVGLFAHQSEHVSFQIMTPTAKIRLSHGRLHQLPMRDPTNLFDLPDHLAWQMNMAIDHHDMSLYATGVLGETLVPTVDETGGPIMQGMGCIRGVQEDYRVKGPLGTIFSQDQRLD